MLTLDQAKVYHNGPAQRPTVVKRERRQCSEGGVGGWGGMLQAVQRATAQSPELPGSFQAAAYLRNSDAEDGGMSLKRLTEVQLCSPDVCPSRS